MNTTSAAKARNRFNNKKFREKYPERHASYSGRNWELKNPSRALWLGARRRARRLGILFNLEAEDVIIPEFCPISGVKLEIVKNPSDEQKERSPSLDRIIPELGYVKGNTIIIAWRMKSNKK